MRKALVTLVLAAPALAALALLARDIGQTDRERLWIAAPGPSGVTALAKDADFEIPLPPYRRVVAVRLGARPSPGRPRATFRVCDPAGRCRETRVHPGDDDWLELPFAEPVEGGLVRISLADAAAPLSLASAGGVPIAEAMARIDRGVPFARARAVARVLGAEHLYATLGGWVGLLGVLTAASLFSLLRPPKPAA